MTQRFQRILGRWGRTVTVCHDGAETNTRAFLQSEEERGTEPPFAIRPLGALDERRWLYIGGAEAPVTAGDRVRCGETEFVAQNAAAVWLGGEICHYWACLRPAKEAAV